jgi:hypothetical protein
MTTRGLTDLACLPNVNQKLNMLRIKLHCGYKRAKDAITAINVFKMKLKLWDSHLDSKC